VIQFNTPTIYSERNLKMSAGIQGRQSRQSDGEQFKRLTRFWTRMPGRLRRRIFARLQSFIFESMCDILFDEKMPVRCTSHPAGLRGMRHGNRSAVHWDMV